MKRLWAVIAGLTVLAGTHLLFSQEQAPPAARVVIAKAIEKELALTTPIVGIIDFDRISSVSTEVQGVIKSIFFREGEFVEKDAILAELDMDFTEKDIEIAQNKLEEIDIKLQEAKKNLERLDKLYKTSATSEQEYDVKHFFYKQLLKQKEQLVKDIEKLNLRIEKSRIKAPFKGIVLEKFKEVGEWVSPESPVCMIASVDDIYVKVAVSEDIKKFVKTGDTINLTVNALGKEFQGKLDSFIPVADMKSKTFYLKIKISYFEHALRNMSVIVNVPVSEPAKLTLVKRDALVEFGGQNFIYTVNGHTAKPLPVVILAYNGEYVGVKGPGIVTGLPVVIDGNERLRPGQPVEVVGEK